MKQVNFRIGLVILCVFSVLNAHAQFGNLMQKAKDKAAQKASEMMDKKLGSTTTASIPSTSKSAPAPSSPANSRTRINSAFDFNAGDSLLVYEDFAGSMVGSSPGSIKTNGSGSVVTLNNESGKWLALEANATYRLKRQHFYPRHFTLEFDLLASADQIRDLDPVTFGFTNNNSVSEYINSSGEYVSLKYYNNNDVSVANQNGKSLSTEYDLTPYANRVMHISMEIEGERMVVYLDKFKLVDTQLFLSTDTKNFYLSAPLQYHNGSKLLFSNLKISTFKKLNHKKA